MRALCFEERGMRGFRIAHGGGGARAVQRSFGYGQQTCRQSWRVEGNPAAAAATWSGVQKYAWMKR